MEDVAPGRPRFGGAALRWLLVFVYACVITYFSSRSGGQLPRWSFMAHDKILHAIEYSGFGFLLCNSLGGRVWLAVLAGTLFGVVDEFHQSFVPGRNGNDPGDMLADLTGALIGALLFVMVTRILQRRAAAVTKTA